MNNFARIRDLDTLAMDNNVIPQTYSDEHGTSCQYPPLAGASRDQNTHLINWIPAGMFDRCKDVTVGVGVVIEDGVRFMCDKVTIGDFVYIGRGTTIRTPEFSVGDYTRINEASYGGGRKPLRIGRNVYLGRGVYLDSNGGLTLEDNTLAGAYSQLWTHIEGGDMIQGCAPWLHQERELIVRKDAWLVGRVVVSNATEIGERAVVLNESNVLRNIPADTVWGGIPLHDMTDKLGRQFEESDAYAAFDRLVQCVDEFNRIHPEFTGKIVSITPGGSYDARYPITDDCTFIDVLCRTYTKKRTAAEVAFLKFTSGKFTPFGED